MWLKKAPLCNVEVSSHVEALGSSPQNTLSFSREEKESQDESSGSSDIPWVDSIHSQRRREGSLRLSRGLRRPCGASGLQMSHAGKMKNRKMRWIIANELPGPGTETRQLSNQAEPEYLGLKLSWTLGRG